MKTFNNELSIRKGETFTISKIVQNKDGSPYIISNTLVNPFFLLTIASAKYQQAERYVKNYWLDLHDAARFTCTKPLDLTKMKVIVDGTARYCTSFDDVTSRQLVPASSTAYYLVYDDSGYSTKYYDYNDAVFYVESSGTKTYKRWNNTTSSWTDYTCRITTVVSATDSNEFVEQNYLYSINLLSGELDADNNKLKTIDVSLTILPATKLSVSSNLYGGSI